MKSFIVKLVQGIHRLWMAGASRGRSLYYRLLGVDIRGFVWMRAIEIPRQWTDIVVEDKVGLDKGVVLLASGTSRAGKLHIKSGTYVNRYTIFDAHARLEVGRDCMIGPHCYITDADHGTEAGTPVKAQRMSTAPVVIEDEVWIGAHVVVLPGVRIGTGAVVGAGSVVTRDVPAHAVAVGAPARVVRFRDARPQPQSS